MYVCMYVDCVRLCARMCLCACVFIYVHTDVRTYINACMHAIGISLHTYLHTDIHTYIHNITETIKNPDTQSRPLTGSLPRHQLLMETGILRSAGNPNPTASRPLPLQAYAGWPRELAHPGAGIQKGLNLRIGLADSTWVERRVPHVLRGVQEYRIQGFRRFKDLSPFHEV